MLKVISIILFLVSFGQAESTKGFPQDVYHLIEQGKKLSRSEETKLRIFMNSQMNIATQNRLVSKDSKTALLYSTLYYLSNNQFLDKNDLVKNWKLQSVIPAASDSLNVGMAVFDDIKDANNKVFLTSLNAFYDFCKQNQINFSNQLSIYRCGAFSDFGLAAAAESCFREVSENKKLTNANLQNLHMTAYVYYLSENNYLKAQESLQKGLKSSMEVIGQNFWLLRMARLDFSYGFPDKTETHLKKLIIGGDQNEIKTIVDVLKAEMASTKGDQATVNKFFTSIQKMDKDVVEDSQFKSRVAFIYLNLKKYKEAGEQLDSILSDSKLGFKAQVFYRLVSVGLKKLNKLEISEADKNFFKEAMQFYKVYSSDSSYLLKQIQYGLALTDSTSPEAKSQTELKSQILKNSPQNSLIKVFSLI